MHITNEIFYHVHKKKRGEHWSPLWQVGKKVFRGQKDLNIYNKLYDDYSIVTPYTNGAGVKCINRALEIFREQPKEYQLENFDKMLLSAHGAIHDLSVFVRETIFEEVRTHFFPELPSRRTCAWVCRREAIPYWWSQMKGQDTDKKILKMSLTGILHKADQKYLVADTLAHNVIRSNAFHYWTWTEKLSPDEEEILFEGVMDILEEYKDLNEFEDKVIEIQ